MDDIFLRRWVKRLGESEYVSLSNEVITSINNKPGYICGGYAKYREGFFAAWVSNGVLYILCDNNTIQVSKNDIVRWRSTAKYREFCVTNKSDIKLKFKYLSFYKYFIDHMTSIVLLDDDWFPYNDFPSFVDSCRNTLELDNLIEWANGI